MSAQKALTAGPALRRYVERVGALQEAKRVTAAGLNAYQLTPEGVTRRHAEVSDILAGLVADINGVGEQGDGG